MCYLQNPLKFVPANNRSPKVFFRAWMSISKFTIREEFAERSSTLPDLEMPWTVSSVALERQTQAAGGHSDVKPAKYLQRGRQEGRRTRRQVTQVNAWTSTHPEVISTSFRQQLNDNRWQLTFLPLAVRVLALECLTPSNTASFSRASDLSSTTEIEQCSK